MFAQIRRPAAWLSAFCCSFVASSSHAVCPLAWPPPLPKFNARRRHDARRAAAVRTYLALWIKRGRLIVHRMVIIAYDMWKCGATGTILATPRDDRRNMSNGSWRSIAKNAIHATGTIPKIEKEQPRITRMPRIRNKSGRILSVTSA